jgi:hypothetical protein
VRQAVKVDDKGNATISGLGGNFSVGKDVNVSEADLGVAIYPGAARGEGGMKMTLPTGSVDSEVFVTDDPVSAVVAFYKGKLGENEVDTETGNGTMMSSGKESTDGGPKQSTIITVTPGTGKNSGKTQLAVVHTVSTK